MLLKVDKLRINNLNLDKRYKLTIEDKEEILNLYLSGNYTQTELAKLFKVNRKSIYNIIYPEKYEESKKNLYEKIKNKEYYNKEKHRQYIKKHRDYKKQLLEKGLI